MVIRLIRLSGDQDAFAKRSGCKRTVREGELVDSVFTEKQERDSIGYLIDTLAVLRRSLCMSEFDKERAVRCAKSY